MGSGVAEGLPSAPAIKVHAQMCSELLKLVTGISKIFPEIEASRPRCLGIEALCSLNNGLVKAKSIIQYCTESSALYLALTGEAIVSRCKKSRDSLEQNLGHLQNMVPVLLAEKISGSRDDLRNASFCLDPPEEEAGKLLHELLHNYGSTFDSTEEITLYAIQSVSSLLHITSQNALLVEKRSIKKLLDRIRESESIKGKILKFFLNLLSKYGKLLTEEETDNNLAENKDPFSSSQINRLSFPEFHGVKSWETSSSSIRSLSSSMNDLNLSLEFSQVSLGSSEGSYSFPDEIGHDIDVEFLSKLSSLSWDSRCNAVENLTNLLKKNKGFSSMKQFEKFVQLVVRFLKDAHELCDVEARMSGCLLLLETLQRNGNSTISYMNEEPYALLASFLDSEVSKQALFILQELSLHSYSHNKIAKSGALTSISNILNTPIHELLEPALKLLINLSSNGSLISLIPLIPKLIPLFEDDILAGYCILILKNLCEIEDARDSIAENGCIPVIAKILEKDSLEDQENAVSVLLSLFSNRVVHCGDIMVEGVIPGLVSVSINGSDKGKAMARELLRIPREESDIAEESPGLDVIIDSTKRPEDKNHPPLKSLGLFRNFFSKKKK